MFGIVPKIQSFVCSWSFWPSWAKTMLNHEQGPFTIFFYTPLAKLFISLANINDMQKPIEQVNTLQQCVITLSGTLFARWCCVINPKVYVLGALNAFMATTGIYQLYRKQYQYIINQQESEVNYFEEMCIHENDIININQLLYSLQKYWLKLKNTRILIIFYTILIILNQLYQNKCDHIIQFPLFTLLILFIIVTQGSMVIYQN